MLKTQTLSDPNNLAQYFCQADSLRSTWVVRNQSDQRRLLELKQKTIPLFPTEHVLRVKDFWLFAFKKKQAEESEPITVLDDYFSGALGNQFLKLISSPDQGQLSDFLAQLKNNHKAARVLQKATQYFLPLFSHPSWEELCVDWFKQYPESFESWGNWLMASSKYYRWMLFEKKCIYRSWLASNLMDSKWEGLDRSRQYFFELGPNPDPLELMLIQSLSKVVSVTHFIPEEENRSTVLNSIIDTRKYPGMIQEVAAAVNQLQEWVSHQISLTDILVVASDPEQYQLLFDHQLIESKKHFLFKRQSTAFNHPMVQHILSQLLQRIGSTTLGLYRSSKIYEGPVYSPDIESEIKRQSFLYDLSIPMYSSSKDKKDNHLFEDITFNEFQNLVISSLSVEFVSDDCVSLVTQILNRIYEQGGIELALNIKDWLGLFRFVSQHTPWDQSASLEEFLIIEDLQTASFYGKTHVLILGLNESSLRKKIDLPLQETGIQNFLKTCGFNLPSLDSEGPEWNLKWNLKNSKLKKVVISAAEEDLYGRSLGVHSIFLLNRTALQKNLSSPIDEAVSPKTSSFSSSLIMTYDGSISATSLELYRKCPFLFYERQIAKQEGLPNQDLLPSSLDKGSAIHEALGCFLKGSKIPIELTQVENSDVLNFLNEFIKKKKIDFSSEILKRQSLMEWTDTVKQVLLDEIKYRKSFPSITTIATELLVEGYLNCHGEFFKNPPTDQTFWKFRGRIDRVDQDDQGQLFLIDYKTSVTAMTQGPSWIDNNNLQLLIYSNALEAGLSELSGTIVGLMYYGFRDQSREKFLINKDSCAGYINVRPRSPGFISEAEWDEIKKSLKVELALIAQNLKIGNFNPKPLFENKCSSCSSRFVCHAEHL